MPDDDDTPESMEDMARRWNAKSRGYANYWEWGTEKGNPLRAPELAVARALHRFLMARSIATATVRKPLPA
ncbi:MAG: hypothetical protein AAFY66_05905 [Pseudomonadota bacterium]